MTRAQRNILCCIGALLSCALLFFGAWFREWGYALVCLAMMILFVAMTGDS